MLAKIEGSMFRLAVAMRDLACSTGRQLHQTSQAVPIGGAQAPPSRRVVVTGLGLVTPLGVGTQETWGALLQGHSGIRPITTEDLPEAHRSLLPQLPSRIAAFVPRPELQTALAALEEDSRRSSPFMLYAMCAAAEALADAQWLPSSSEERRQTGVAVGCGMSSTSEVAEAGQLVASGKIRRMSPFFVPRILNNMAAGAISIRYGIHGPNHTVSTACATGAHSIGDAYCFIQRGDASVMIAGATEACIDGVSLAGFARLKALSTAYNDRPTEASRPFDKGRDGFVMGEGAGMLILEELSHAQQRGARIYAEVRGYGLSGDGHHITHPHPEGLGAQLAMQRALHHSGVSPSHVSYINAHATSTPSGDAIEQAAIVDLFQDSPVLVSSTKGATGHLLGAAGAVEAAFTVLALHHGVAPPTLNLTQQDPSVLRGLVGCAPRTFSNSDVLGGPVAAMSNSFGFGGTNASLLFISSPAV